MELTRKVLIFTAFIGLGFVAATLRIWVLGGRQNSFKRELKETFLFILIFVAIATVIIYINN